MENFPANLTEAEKETLYNMPIYVSVLIAGADDKIDQTEIASSIEFAELKKHFSRSELHDYYNIASADFKQKLYAQIAELPASAEARTKYLIDKLSELNDILPKLDRRFANDFYHSARDLAKKIAESSGGVLGFMSIGYEESHLIGLNMIKDPADS